MSPSEYITHIQSFTRDVLVFVLSLFPAIFHWTPIVWPSNSKIVDRLHTGRMSTILRKRKRFYMQRICIQVWSSLVDNPRLRFTKFTIPVFASWKSFSWVFKEDLIYLFQNNFFCLGYFAYLLLWSCCVILSWYQLHGLSNVRFTSRLAILL